MTIMASLIENKSKNKNYFLKSSRLGFRLWREEDLDIALKLWGDYAVTKFFDARGKWSREAVQDRLIKEIRLQRQHGVQYWPVKLVIPLGAALLLLQGLARLSKDIMVLTGSENRGD